MDQWAAESLNPSFESMCIGLCAATGFIPFLIRRDWLYLVPGFLAVFIVAALPFIDTSPVKPAVRAIHEVRPGFSEAQVLRILDHYFPQNGRFRRPEFGSVRNDLLSFVIDNRDGRYDAAVVQIQFYKGKCISAEFLAD
jgi:hypothetical protein